MAGEDGISYTDMDIEKVINDFSNRFINEISIWKAITYATKQLGFEKVIEDQRNCAWPSYKKGCVHSEAYRLRGNN